MAPRVVRQLPGATVRHARRFGLLGLALDVETNDPRLLEIADAAFGRFPVPDAGEPIVLTVILERQAGSPIDGSTEWETRSNGTHDGRHRFEGVAYRTRGSTGVISSPSLDVATIDFRAGRALAYLGEAGLADPRGLRYAFIEAMAYWAPAYARGYLTIHASGVARAGSGLVLDGPAGAGKSTLAVAAARRGLSVFAEDAVFARLAPAGLELWGAPWIQRLLPDSRELFPELAGLPIVRQPNGEDKLELDLDAWFPGTATPSARPAAIVALERHPGARTELVELDGADAAGSPELLWPYDLDWRPEHHAVADALASLPRFRLVAGGTPDQAVDALEDLLARLAVEPASPVG